MSCVSFHRRAACAALSAIALTLTVAVALAQTPPAPEPAKTAADDGIDAFLENLERNQPAPASPAPDAVGDRAAQDAAAAPVAAASTPAEIADSTLAKPTPVEDVVPLMTDDSSPLRTLFLMLGGIVACALATIGLTLAVFAMRKDMRHKRRARQRTFVPYPPKKQSPAA